MVCGVDGMERYFIAYFVHARTHTVLQFIVLTPGTSKSWFGVVRTSFSLSFIISFNLNYYQCDMSPHT